MRRVLSRCLPPAAVITGALVAAIVSCESPFEPQGEGERVPINREITGEVGGDTLARYSFVAESGGAYAVFLAALEGSVRLAVRDSTHQYTAATLAALPGSGSVALTVIDPVAKEFLGYVFADAGTDNPLTTGRIRLPATRDYQFILSSVISNQYPRYRGPYRFWTYLVNRAPEHRAAPIPFDTEIGNERIDRAGDVDEFTCRAAGGADYIAFVQGGGRTFQLEVAAPGGPTLAVATSQASDTALFRRATNRFQIANAGTYVVRVTGTNPYQVADTGAYRVYLYAIDRRPEHLPSAITPGDTVTGEDIGLP